MENKGESQWTWTRTLVTVGKGGYSLFKLAKNFTPGGATQLVAGYTLIPAASYVGKTTGWYDEKNGEYYAGWAVEGIALGVSLFADPTSYVVGPVTYIVNKAAQTGAGYVANTAIEKLEIENPEIRDVIQFGAAEIASVAADKMAKPLASASKKLERDVNEKVQMYRHGKAVRVYRPDEKVIKFADRKDHVVKETVYADGKKKIVLASGMSIRGTEAEIEQFYKSAKKDWHLEHLAKNNAVVLKTPNGAKIQLVYSEWEDRPYFRFFHGSEELKTFRSGLFYPDEVNTDFTKWKVMQLSTGEEVLKDPNGRLHPTMGFKESISSKGFDKVTSVDGRVVDGNTSGWKPLAEEKVFSQKKLFTFFKPKEDDSYIFYIQLIKLGNDAVKLYCQYRKLMLELKAKEQQEQAEAMQQERAAQAQQDQNNEAARRQEVKQAQEKNTRKEIQGLEKDIQSLVLQIQSAIMEQLLQLWNTLPNDNEEEIVKHFKTHISSLAYLLEPEEANSPLSKMIASMVEHYPLPVQARLNLLLNDNVTRQSNARVLNNEQEKAFFEKIMQRCVQTQTSSTKAASGTSASDAEQLVQLKNLKSQICSIMAKFQKHQPDAVLPTI